MINNENPTYISLADAASYCDYSQDYLSLRARQGKLKAVKMGRNWVTRQEWLNKYIAKFSDVPSTAAAETTPSVERAGIGVNQTMVSAVEAEEPFISLHQASNLCEYSQEYLSLRARQGKLEAVKLGRNWVTKKSWVLTYVGRTSGRIEMLAEEEQQIFTPEFVIGREKAGTAVSKPKQQPFLVDDNLTDEIKEEIREALEHESEKKFIFAFQLTRRTVTTAICALVFISIMSIAVAYRQPLGSYASKTIRGGVIAGQNIGNIINNAVGDTVKSTFNTVKDTGIGYAISIKNTFKENRGVVKTKQAGGFLSKQTGIIKKGAVRFYSQFAEGISNIPTLFIYYISSDIKALGRAAKNGFDSLLVRTFDLSSQKEKDIAKSLQNGLKDYAQGVFWAVKSQIASAGRFFRSRISAEVELAKIENQRIKNSIISFAGNSIKSIGKIGSGALYSIKSIANDLTGAVGRVSRDAGARAAGATHNTRAFLAGARKVFREMAEKIIAPFKVLAKTIKNIPRQLSGLFNRGDKIPVDDDGQQRIGPNALKPRKDGLVVIPSSGDVKDEEITKQIQESFSDEVRVTPKDDDSGIIVPVFKEKEGDEYLYIMVPIDN